VTSVVDTLGAGDTFIAGFLDAHLRGLDLQAALDAGRAAAAATCAHFGGFPQAPVPL
jgi:fructoselysine 6-kinase